MYKSKTCPISFQDNIPYSDNEYLFNKSSYGLQLNSDDEYLFNKPSYGLQLNSDDEYLFNKPSYGLLRVSILVETLQDSILVEKRVVKKTVWQNILSFMKSLFY
jgi:hypothetical protein